MQGHSTLARRYARALYEAATAAEAAGQVGDDLVALVASIWQDAGRAAFFQSGQVAAGDKKQLIRELGGDRCHQLVTNLACLSVDKRRESYLPEIARQYGVLLDRAQGISDVEVRTAVPLGAPEQESFTVSLTAKLGGRVRVNFVVDPSIVGGVQVKAADKLFDASLRRRLERLGEHLAKARVGV